MTTVYLGHDLDKAAELKARIAVVEYCEKFPRSLGPKCSISRDYFTHVEGDDAEDCRLLLRVVLDAIGDRR